MNIYKSLLEISCPVKIIKLGIHRKFIKREPCRPITKGLIISLIHKAKLHKKKLKRKSPELINKYRIYCSIFNKIKRAAKVKYYTEMLNIYTQTRYKRDMANYATHNVQTTWNYETSPNIRYKWARSVKFKIYCRTV